MNRNNPALWLAAALSLALSIAAGVSGWQRSGLWLESLLWAVLSILAVLTAHLLPALLNRRGWLALVALPVWAGVFAVVAFSHAQFFTLAEMHAGQERGGLLRTEHTQQLVPPPLVVGTAPGRSAPVVARDLAKASAALVWLPEARRPAQREAVEALRLELATVQQQDALHRADMAQQQASIEAKAADPVGLRLGQAVGIAPGSVMLVVALATALVLELASVILWRLALVTPAPGMQGDATQTRWHWRRWPWLSTNAGQQEKMPASEVVVPTSPQPEFEPDPVQGSTAAMPVIAAEEGHAPTPADAAAIVALIRVRGAVTWGTLQASVSRRVRPMLADILDGLEQSGVVRITSNGRGKLITLAA